MDADDPEKRIAELERGLGNAVPASGQVDAEQQAGSPSPPVDWQDPSQTPSALWSSPSPRRYASSRGPILLLVSVGITILVAAVGIALAITNPFATKVPTASAPNEPTSSASGPTQLHTADGLSGLLASIRNRFGDTMGYSLSLYPDYAVLDRADPGDNRIKQNFVYRDGEWTSGSSDTSVSSVDSLADLSAFDVAAVTAQIPGAAQTLGITRVTATHLQVRGHSALFDVPGEVNVGEGGLDLSIYVSGPLSGRVEVNADGSVKKLYPPS